jgi:hypothetical protein
MGSISTLFYGAIALAGGYVAWQSAQQERGYPVALPVAAERLSDMTFEDSMLKLFKVKKTSQELDGTREMRWTFSRRGKPGTASCTALLTPLGPKQTEAQYECAVDGNRPDMQMAKAGAGLVKVLFAQHFAAAIEARPLDKRALGMATSAYAVSMQPMMAKRMQ